MKIQYLMALVVLSLATVPGARAAVLAGPITNAANGHLYYLLSANTWTASEAEAIGLGGHLVTINNAAENQWVVNTFFPLTGGPNDWLWIGLNDAATEGRFFWAGEEGAVTMWASGEPFTTDVEDYAAIERLSGRWRDLSDTYGLENPTAPTFGVVEVAVAVTLPANQFIPGSARLNGRVSPIGSPTLAWFEWGTSLAYGNVTPPQSVGSGGNAVGFSNVVVGLVSGTNYHFRARASNAFGFFAGLNQTFNLGSQRPGVTSLAADQLSYTSARLKGQVNPRGWPTAAWFEWGTTTNYGNVIGMQDVGQGSSTLNLSVVLNGLTTTNYHYRLVASNAFGAVNGANQTINLSVVPTKITWTGADLSGYWSAPANWFPNDVPTNGADLVFPGGLPPEDMVSTNDLTDSIFRSITFSGAGGYTIRGNPMTLTNRSDCIIHSGTNVIACDLTFSGTTPTFTTIWSSSFNSGELTMTGNVGGGSLYAFGGRLVIRGQFTGGTLRKYGGTLAFYGDHSHAVSVEFQGDSSTLFVQGSQPNLNITMFWEMESAACPHFTGNGVVGDVTGCGHITLDSTLSVKNISRGVCGTCYYNTLAIRLNGTNAGEYGKLVASGEVSLSTGSLLPSPGFNPQPGQVFTVVEKTSPGPIANAFLGPEGKITTLNGMPFRISYVGGDGNDLTLTALGFVPTPIPGLPGVYGSFVAWGDYDNDGRLDFLLTGNGTGAGSQLWRNTGGGFSNVTASVAPGLPAVYVGSVAWGDYDNDNRLDFLITGSGISQLWRNTGSGFSNVTASVAPGLPGFQYSSVAWGDYDNDGRLDFLIKGSSGAQLWRNTGSGFSNVTASVAPGLPGSYGGSVAWGDYDNDGRLDLLLTGAGSQLWRNTSSGFSNVTASVAPGLPGAAYGGAWGDYDNDGRLDFLLNGSGIFQLWRNTGAGFSNVTASVAPGLPTLYGTSVAWGDFDNDGRLDFLLTGTTDGEVPPVGGNERSQLWRNTGGGFSNVTASVAPGLPGVYGGSMAWGDYDNDGRLDFLLTGNPGISQLWRNNMPVASNAPPAAPTGLSSTLSGATVSLSWNPPADDRTPSTGLNYNLRIGTTPGASDVLAPMALTDGLRLLPALGNAQAGTNAFVFNVAPGRDYYWSVQAVDTSFAGSPFAAEQQFTVAAPRLIELLMLGNGHFQFSFSNEASVIYAVLGTTNVALPLAQWTVLGPPVSLGGGLYRFTDLLATNHAQRFYLLRQQ